MTRGARELLQHGPAAPSVSAALLKSQPIFLIKKRLFWFEKPQTYLDKLGEQVVK